ncbi:NAD(P)-dependent oxidoreductase [Candidatus Binatia bacterium]|nr:NAD(P)-dependent oxidoreductase [Candidatus Binatia bacterium]
MSDRVLVAGATGFIGAALVARFARDGVPVVGVSRSAGIDLADLRQARELGRCAVIVNAAGRTSVPASCIDPRSFRRDNVEVVRSLLELARRDGAHVVQASSYVYGTPRRLPIDESHPLAAHNPYAASKLEAETLCTEHHRATGLPVTILRVFNAYGPSQRAGMLVPTIVAGIRAGTIEIADATPRRDFVHVDDVVDAFARAVARRPAGCAAINVGSGRSTSVAELVDLAIRASGRAATVRVKHTPRPNEIADVVADVRKAGALLGWRPRIELASGVGALLRASGVAA